MFRRIIDWLKKPKPNTKKGIFVYHDGTCWRREDASRIAVELDSRGMDFDSFFTFSQGFSELVNSEFQGAKDKLKETYQKKIDDFCNGIRDVFDVPCVAAGGLSSIQLIELATQWSIFAEEMIAKAAFFTYSSRRAV